MGELTPAALLSSLLQHTDHRTHDQHTISNIIARTL